MAEGMTDDASYFEEAREALIAEIEAEIRDTRDFVGIDTLSSGVLRALRAVPREAFVPEKVRDLAYINRPLAIGHGQTISQPYIVAVMTEMLSLSADSRVLEIGTGCGYQTAVLAVLAKEVFTIEVVRPLGEAAAARLRERGYENIHFRIGDGRLGWPEHAPFDRIIVTAAAPERPSALLDQLAAGGRMVVPLGRSGFTQQLTCIDKDAEGVLRESGTLPVAFVPLVKGWS